MNIFYLSHDPVIAAQWLIDKHVVKMCLESVQILCTAHHMVDGYNDWMYKPTHANHPSVKWARNNVENYNWLVRHTNALLIEYSHRYNKEHKSIHMFKYVMIPPENLHIGQQTIIPSVMDKKYIISDDPVVNYRNYYRLGKVHLHKWTNRNKPYWI